MTLDVTIGKIVTDYDFYGNKPTFWVESCPNAEQNICNSKYTDWPKEAYRSGSTAFWEFFQKQVGQIYYDMRDHPNSNDRGVSYIKPFLERINALTESNDDVDKDRMKWLKYWCNKAVELYDSMAGIMFS